MLPWGRLISINRSHLTALDFPNKNDLSLKKGFYFLTKSILLAKKPKNGLMKPALRKWLAFGVYTLLKLNYFQIGFCIMPTYIDIPNPIGTILYVSSAEEVQTV